MFPEYPDKHRQPIPSMPDLITLFASRPDSIASATHFGEQHHYPVTKALPVSTPFYLDFDSAPLSLHDTINKTELTINFTAGALAHRLQFGGGKGQTIAKAMGITSKNKPHILDATAGLGRDALVLANLGCPMTLCEQSAVLALMLETAITDATNDEVFQGILARGFKLFNANAIDLMRSGEIKDIDVIYLDPMYPDRKKTALVKKEMQMLQTLIGHSTDDENAELLTSALQLARQRVIVKRPKGAPHLTATTPTLSLASKKTRYDIYVIRAMTTS